jgi:hypothetical protein
MRHTAGPWEYGRTQARTAIFQLHKGAGEGGSKGQRC